MSDTTLHDTDPANAPFNRLLDDLLPRLLGPVELLRTEPLTDADKEMI